MKRIYLVDVSSLFFRAFYAIRPLTSPSGMPTNAIYGFLSMITKLLKEERPDHIVFCYDRKEPSFRNELYADYKANRAETPEDLVPQIPYIKKLADYLGIPSLELSGFEADDLIGALTKVSRHHGLEVFIVSGDKDFGQLVEPHVWLYDTMKNTKLDSAGVKEKWGIRPDQMIDYLALVGDSSDNVPGVFGIGPKGAQKLLEQYETLENIYKHVDEIKGATQEKLKSGKDSAFLSKKLVSIAHDAPISKKIEDYHIQKLKRHELQALMHELGFQNLERTIEALPQNPNGEAAETEPLAPLPEKKHETIQHDIRAESLEVHQIKSHLSESATLWIFSTTQGICIGDEKKKTVFVLQGDRAEISSALSQLKTRWLGFDLKTLWHELGLQNSGCGWDSQLAAYVIKAGESMEFDRVFSRFTGEMPADLLTADVAFAQQLELKKSLQKKTKEIHADKILQEIEFPLVEILYQMECLGVKIDRDLLAEQGQGLHRDLHQLEKDIYAVSGETFNIASPKQLGHVMFDQLKLPVMKKTKTGYSTDNEVLEKLKSEHPIADLVLQYRELAKLKSTYVDALPLLIKEDGRIHTTFNQALTATGRLSSTEPNLQNIPIRTERGARVRKAFIAEKGKKLLSVDYSQIELRILAHYSEDQNLVHAFHENLDIHQATAAEVFGVSLKEVTPDQRRAAKAVNFGIAYGQGAFGLAENLGISRGEASEIIKKYFSKFPGVQKYIDETIQEATDKGYVETLYGRRRYIDELKSHNQMIKRFGERAAINAPIQGTASDIVKIAMIELHKKIKTPMILQVHDELIFEGPEKELKNNLDEIVQIMENVIQMKVPLKANAVIGSNWDEAH